MAEPAPLSSSGAPRSTVSCPECGSQVTEESARDGDKGKVFHCPNCGKLFGIVPGISGPVDMPDPS
jgi:transcription elongation factor Elf1